MKTSSLMAWTLSRTMNPVTNGAIVIHTQRLKSDPGGNLLS
ncbi:coproporphyrinogen III oxidase [Escherichia coli]|nr:coproporphyrinogen III oxidase [Escherichia coli]QAR42387.1 coproporphyrinogen III oxidase [Escherichia coli]